MRITPDRPRSQPGSPLQRPIRWPLAAGLVTGLCACTPDPSKLQVTYGPWSPLHEGSAPQGPVVPVSRVLTQGNGPRVEPGMMIEVNAVTTFGEKQVNVPARDKVRDLGRHWIYVAFDSDGLPDPGTMELKTAEDAAAKVFGAGGSRFAASFIGLPLGHKVTFGPRPDQTESRSIVGGLGVVPFGSFERYAGNKPMARDSGAPVYTKTPELDNETTLEIVRLCKGHAAQRLVTLQDTTEISIAQDIGRSHTTSQPRWMYLREARWTGTCNDGKAMHFDYGPVLVSPPPGRDVGLGISQLFGPWVMQAWQKIDLGVASGP